MTIHFFKKEILLKGIMAVHRFGIHSSVSSRAKIFDLDQAAFRSGCPHCSFMYTSPFQQKQPNDIWDRYRQDQHMHPRSLCIRAVSSGSTHISNRIHYATKQCEYCASKRRKSALFTFKPRTLHLWGKGLLCFCSGSNKNNCAFWSI